MLSAPESIICYRCQIPLEESRVNFTYLGHEFHTRLPKCPKCNLVYISEELATGKMADVEMSLEDK